MCDQLMIFFLLNIWLSDYLTIYQYRKEKLDVDNSWSYQIVGASSDACAVQILNSIQEERWAQLQGC